MADCSYSALTEFYYIQLYYSLVSSMILQFFGDGYCLMCVVSFPKNVIFVIFRAFASFGLNCFQKYHGCNVIEGK